jgi:hypothetical protein
MKMAMLGENRQRNRNDALKGEHTHFVEFQQRDPERMGFALIQ